MKITGYKGNEIKEGMEVVVINVVERHSRVGWLIPDLSGKLEEVMEDLRPDSPCWEVIETERVIMLDINRLGFCQKGTWGDTSYTMHDTI